MSGFEHEAFVYGSDEEYARVLAPLAEAALAAGHAVVSVTPEANTVLLREALGRAAADVEWVDADEWYRHPVRTIAGYDRTLQQLAGRPAFVIGEVRFGDTARQWTEWTRYESALNRALHRHAARVVCPYDRRALPASVVDDALRTHPYVLTAGQRATSARYAEPEQVLSSLPVPVAVPDRAPDAVVVADTSVRAARHAFEEVARAAGIDDDRVHDLAVGVSEVLTNAVVHGGGIAFMEIWTGDPLVCVVEDAGNGIDDPLLGMRPPEGGGEGGYGLWYTRQVFERAEITRSRRGGLRVHLEASPG